MIDKKDFFILIVDDNPTNIQIAANLLNSSGYKSGYAKSGEEALLAVKERPYDLILMDVMMPGIDGFEASKRIKQIKEYEEVPIIFVTAKNTDDDILDGFYSGGVDYIIKPFKGQELKARIDIHLKLKHLRDTLENQVKDETEKRLKQERIATQQSKMAAMGEMMDAVAHQWKQPLNALTLYNQLIMMDYKSGSIDEAYLKDFTENIQLQINHMVTTLDEFRNFFRPNKLQQRFKLIDTINSVLLLMKDELLKNRIEVKIEDNAPLTLLGSQNEFKHLLINLLSNSKDAFIENEIKKRVITIELYKNGHFNILAVEDNAGGVPEKIIKDVFKSDVTTKPEGKGTGIGLYMSSQIAQKHHGILSVKNIDNGARFSFVY